MPHRRRCCPPPVFDGRSYLSDAWWIATLPELLLPMTLVALNFVGGAIREMYAPPTAGD